jgi:hypothetical protein
MCVNLRIKNHGVHRVTRRNKVQNRFRTPWYSVTSVVKKIDKNVWEAIT